MISRKLLSYSLLSAAFLSIENEANSQVWYYDYEPDSLITYENTTTYVSSYGTTVIRTGQHPVDLNGDGVVDMSITSNRNFYNGSSTFDFTNVYSAVMNGSNRIAKLGLLAFKLEDGDTISSALNFSVFPYNKGLINRKALSTSSTIQDGMWTDAYGSYYGSAKGAMALMVMIDGQPHYGWLRFRLRNYLVDYMLSAEPNKPIVVGENPCQRPFDLEITAIAPTIVQVTWEEVYSAGSYQIRARKVGTSSIWEVSSPTNSKISHGLTPGTTYEWQVRAVCADGSFTAFSQVNTFTTPVLLPAHLETQREHIKDRTKKAKTH